MKKLIYLSLLINSFGVLNAQQYELRGKVTDRETNQPLHSATVVIKKSNISILTDANGYFSIPDLPSSIIITVSHVGFETAEYHLNDLEKSARFINVRLSFLYKQGDEVVVSASKRPEKITDAPA